MNPDVKAFFHAATNTLSYVVSAGNDAVIIDPVLDYDPHSGRTSASSAEEVLDWIGHHGLTVRWILETHVHADHLSAAQHLRSETGAPVAIGADITIVQRHFGGLFNAGDGFRADGSQFDRLLSDGDPISAGELTGRVIHTPGHTPACVTYLFGDAAFVGDTLFMPDFGTARADFPGGDAATLYGSIRRILALPGDTRIFVGHDYLPEGRDRIAWETTVAEQRSSNVHVQEGTSEAQFVALRSERDQRLAVPRLLLPAIQVNMRAGMMPPPEDNGTSYLKIPINRI